MEQGWSGVFFEGRRKRFVTLEATYRGNANANPACAMVGFDPAQNSLDHLLAKTPIPKSFDVLSIDIDGNDWYIWDSLLEYRPARRRRRVQSDHRQRRRLRAGPRSASQPGLFAAGAVRSRGPEGLRARRCDRLGTGFSSSARRSRRSGIADNSPEAMHDDRFASRMWHGFDGTISSQADEAPMEQSRVGAEDIQALPRWRRIYGSAKRAPSRLVLMLHEAIARRAISSPAFRLEAPEHATERGGEAHHAHSAAPASLATRSCLSSIATCGMPTRCA